MVEKEYYSRLGTYLDLVIQTAALAGIKPKMMLVATKVEDLDKCKESLVELQGLAKAHLTSINAECFLVGDIMKTSSRIVGEDMFRELYSKVFALCTAEELRTKPLEVIPISWYKLLDALKLLPHVTIDQVISMLQKIKSEQTGPPTIEKGVLLSLRKTKEVMAFLTKANKQTKVNKKDSEVPIPQLKEEQGSANVEHREREMPVETQVKDKKSRKKAGKSKGSSSNMEAIEEGVQKPENSPLPADVPDREEEYKARRDEVITIVDFFKGNGELLHYPDNTNLSELVITRPMDFVRSLRTVISHKTVKNFKKAQFQEQQFELLQKGLLSYDDFVSIYRSGPEQAFSEAQVWDFLIQLQLACPMDAERRQILVPSLITDSMEEVMKTREKELERSEACVVLQYNFDKNLKSVAMYNRFLRTLTESMMLGDKGGEIHMSYSQKVEMKKLGNVAAVQGVLRWSTTNIQRPDEFEFLLAEYDTTFPTPDPEENSMISKCYAIHRGIRILLNPSQGPVSAALFEILAHLDQKFSMGLDELQRCLLCKMCLLEGKQGYFQLKEGLELKSTAGRCSRLLHKLDNSLAEAIQKSKEPQEFQLKSLMETEKEALGLEPFGTSEIRMRLLEGNLAVGEQIWVYHDAETDPWNLVARLNPYEQ